MRTDKNNAKLVYKDYGEQPRIELFRVYRKGAGLNLYLPKSVIKFLNLNNNIKALVGFFDDAGELNFIVLTSDQSLVQVLKPLILERRRRAEEIMRQLSTQQQQSEAKTTEVLSERVDG